ncbi:MAG: cysteine--tRNA ligase [Deltaproteobacteria bacterium]|nr:cysteine--tRNA ligase [Deltaproteobacteria bacterium]MCL5276538.1 cysteine--tRNA ligase [Deltaproteobacteria bacterium]
MPLRIYNTLTQGKQEFKPMKEGHVGMYVCGITAYDLCHIGHARSAIVFDTVYRYLRAKGYDVTFVKNFTDIDDKIITRANKEGLTAGQVSEKYIEEYYKDMGKLGLRKPAHEPRATMYINDIVGLVKRLIEKGHAYESNGDVYYAVRSFEGYGKLSGKDIGELEAGARVEPGEAKKDPLDFALWKKSKPGEPSWESPWGKGRPGWHIECSAMSTHYLGDSFDIHGGGMDLIFPHHENEIAQSEGATGKQFVTYWLHNGFIQTNKEKMSKSLGNFFTIREILERFEPQALRLFVLMHHYRNPVDFSDLSLKEAEKALYRGYASLRLVQSLPAEGKPPLSPDKLGAFAQKLSEYETCFYNAMDDDFNTAGALSGLFDLLRLINTYFKDATARPEEDAVQRLGGFVRAAADILGVFDSDPRSFLSSRREKRLAGLGLSKAGIEERLARRSLLRKDRAFKEADEIRAGLLREGISIMDTPGGTVWDIAEE